MVDLGCPGDGVVVIAGYSRQGGLEVLEIPGRDESRNLDESAVL